MNRPAHVGDCPVMSWTRFADGRVFLDQPWEPLVVFSEQLLIQSPFVKWGINPGDEDPTRRMHWRITCDNGWAIYRRVGYDPERRSFVGELVDSEYEPMEGVDGQPS